MIAGVQPAEMVASTPCESWDIRALINHMIYLPTCLVYCSPCAEALDTPWVGRQL